MQIKLRKDGTVQITEGEYLTVLTKDCQVIKKKFGRKLITVATVVGRNINIIDPAVIANLTGNETNWRDE